MKISFVIPAYNEERLIGQCLDATAKTIAEAVRLQLVAPGDVEVVVVNNASTDRTKEVAVQHAHVRVVDEFKKGLVQARKAGFDATTGELVANIDSDTTPTAQWLPMVLSEFAKDPKLVALSGPYFYYDLSSFARMLTTVFYFCGWAFAGFKLQGGNFVIKRDAWERAGGFDTRIAFYGEDTDVARRIAKQGRVRWRWALQMPTTGRRLAHEGIVVMGLKYALNFLTTKFAGRPATHTYTDIRPE